MRYVDITGGFRVHITEEEDELYSRVKEKRVIKKASLNEREREVARRLVSRGVFDRKKIDNEWQYSVNSLKYIERN